jgi:hypothetical protein
MLDKPLAKKLAPLTKDKLQWEALKEYLNSLKNLELQVLVVATSEQELFRSQGKLSFLAKLDTLPEQVEEALNRKDYE